MKIQNMYKPFIVTKQDNILSFKRNPNTMFIILIEHCTNWLLFDVKRCCSFEEQLLLSHLSLGESSH